jgi:hypothetical protein
MGVLAHLLAMFLVNAADRPDGSLPFGAVRIFKL